VSSNRFQHIDLRVSDMQIAYPFYAAVLPALGFPTEDSGERFRCFVGPGEAPFKPWFGFTEDRDHRPNTNRIAFSAASRAEVDRAAETAREAGALSISGPRPCPEYSPSYYAVFFEDPCGNCLEVCYYE
jgi:predicted lactoylglutathione lyase